MLGELTTLWTAAHQCLEPHRGGHGSNTGEPTLGVNLTALDYCTGRPILDILHGWERIIREDRNLTPPALVPAKGSIGQEIAATVKFHLAHLDWSATQPWIDDFHTELATIHSQGQAASRTQLAPVRRIKCPTPTETGTCGWMLSVDDADITTAITCRRCHTNWTVGRLIAVGTADAQSEIWLDSESIGQWLGITAGQVRRICRTHRVPARRNLIELNAFLAARRVA